MRCLPVGSGSLVDAEAPAVVEAVGAVPAGEPTTAAVAKWQQQSNKLQLLLGLEYMPSIKIE